MTVHRLNEYAHTSPADAMRQVDWVGDENRTVEVGAAALVDVPRARIRDPATSHAAAKRVKDSGHLNRQQLEVLALLRRYPGSTAVELARIARPDEWRTYRYVVSRRLPELASGFAIVKGVKVPRAAFARRGRPRVCAVSGSPQTTWYPVDRPDDMRAAA